MWRFGERLLAAIIEKKWAAVISTVTFLALCGVVWAGNTKHNAAVDKIDQNTAQLQAQAMVQIQLVTTLKAMEKHQEAMTDSLKNLNEQVHQVDRTNRDLIDTVVDILKADTRKNRGS